MYSAKVTVSALSNMKPTFILFALALISQAAPVLEAQAGSIAPLRIVLVLIRFTPESWPKTLTSV